MSKLDSAAHMHNLSKGYDHNVSAFIAGAQWMALQTKGALSAETVEEIDFVELHKLIEEVLSE